MCIDDIGAVAGAQCSGRSAGRGLRSMVLCLLPLLGCAGAALATPPVEEWVAVSPGGSGDPAARMGSNLPALARNAMAVDVEGNAYVTGNVSNGSGIDYLTRKFAPDGTVVWSAIYHGTGNGTDYAYALTLDHAGNVLVTGTSMGDGASFDYVTVKYTNTGEVLWVARYAAPGNGNAMARAVTVDSADNVLVTGEAAGNGTDLDYTTVKYSPAGEELWVSRYSGPGNGTDSAYAVEVDSADNVLVTGHSVGIDTGADYATVKYSPAGEELWVRRYNGPGNGDDHATAMAVDNSDNLVIAGSSLGVGTGVDYATVNYSSAGEELWVSRYNGPGNNVDQAHAVAMDSAGYVVVTGVSRGSGTGDDYATIKYTPSGEEMWAVRLDGSGNGDDAAYDLVLDDVDHVVVTGRTAVNGWAADYLTVKYSPSGAELWAVSHGGSGQGVDIAYAVALDSHGYFRVAGSRYDSVNTDFGVVAYDSEGLEIWANGAERVEGLEDRFGSGESDSGARAMAMDAEGNTYVAGRAYNGSNYDFVTRKFGIDGSLLWSAVYNGTGNRDDDPYALALDSNGNVIVTGGSFSSVTATDFATVKYSPAGVELWVARYNGLQDFVDIATAVAVDSEDNVLVTGHSRGSGSANDYVTIKYSSDGTQLWVVRYNGPGNRDDFPKVVVVDSADNVLVTGGSRGDGTNDDYATVKYSPEGEQLWVARYNGPANGYERARAAVVDSADNVLVTGSSLAQGPGADYTTVKYSPDGEQLWMARYNGVNAIGNAAAAIAVDGMDSVVVTGTSIGVGSGGDYATVKYTSSGEEVWSSRYNGAANDADVAGAIALDLAGNVVVTGRSMGVWSRYEYSTVKYAGSDGRMLWAHRHGGNAVGQGLAEAVEVAPDGSMRIGGEVSTDQGRRIVVIKLRDPEVSTTTLSSIAPSPSIVGASVTFTAHVSGASTAPGDGGVTFTASTGEACTASVATPVDFQTSAYACNMVFATAGERALVAAFSGSLTHYDSSSNGLDSHRVRALGTLEFDELSFVYDGNLKVVTAHIAEEPTTTCTVTPAAIGPDAGEHPVHAAECVGIGYLAPAISGTAVIAPQPTVISITDLLQTFDGTPRPVQVTTAPTSNVPTRITYDGGTSPPSAVGTYVVHAVTDDPNFIGAAEAVLQVVPAPASLLVKLQGDGQTAAAGTTVAQAPQVRVEDAFGQPVAAVSVSFAVTSGGGSVSGAMVDTDAAGLAEVGGWTLGSEGGIQTLSAGLVGLPVTPVVFTATAIAQVDIAVSVNPDGAYVQHGATHEHLIAIDNLGVSSATGVEIAVPVPPAHDPETAQWQCVTINGIDCSASQGGGSLQATIGLSAGGSALYLTSARVRVDGLDESVTVQAQVFHADDLDVGNNTDTATTPVVLFRNGFEAGGDGAADHGLVAEEVPGE